LRFSQGAESPLDIDLEDQSAWIVADDEDGVVRKVSTRLEAHEQHQGQPTTHSLPESNVVGMLRIGSPV